ncbi:hypothetical protein BDW74DRAFT_155146 [Aspergillus multicolor]|uniref:uncharacterized protein n=1 Tax=Aspergillus multicolor TaxID=41759 RepID=UPI003CCDC2F2
MIDPFSVSAGVVGVMSLGLTIGQGFLRYYTPWHDYDDEVRGFTIKVNGLLRTLSLLNSFLLSGTDPQFSCEQYRLFVLDNLAPCEDTCRRLENILEECKSTTLSVSHSSSTLKRDWFRLHLKRVAYPFKKEILVTLSELVSGLQDNLNTALPFFMTALMGQQQRQIQDIASRTSFIDLTAAKILTVV